MKSHLLGALCAGIFSLGLTSVVDAALVSVLGGQAVYDDDLDITWMANANLIVGITNWADANAWAASLTVGGFTNWRLPTTTQPDPSCDSQDIALQGFGFDCTGSEMGHLFYNELGGTAGDSILTSGDPDLALFTNIQGNLYWSSTETVDPSFAWRFGFGGGIQTTDQKTFNNTAWAVHSGNIGAVPIPAAVWLFGSGLIGLVGIAKKHKRV